jgi:hypothetical protein
MSSPLNARHLLFSGLLFLQSIPLANIATAHQFRPALVGNGSHSLVNLIDNQKLLAKGQPDSLVMFDAGIQEDGSVDWIWCHAPPEAKTLKEEVEKALRHAAFVPATIDGGKVAILFHGTVIFINQGGRPHLRVFANQDRSELARQGDYIQPQMILDSEDWEGAQPMLAVVKNHARAGHAALAITVDEQGTIRDRRLLREDPTGLNIGAAALKVFSTAKFLPGFRNGQPVGCTFEEDWAVRGYVYHRW